jgi:hypothetical protein
MNTNLNINHPRKLQGTALQGTSLYLMRCTLLGSALVMGSVLITGCSSSNEAPQEATSSSTAKGAAPSPLTDPGSLRVPPPQAPASQPPVAR